MEEKMKIDKQGQKANGSSNKEEDKKIVIYLRVATHKQLNA